MSIVVSREEGSVKAILVILILIFACYAGFQFAMPYYRHSALKSDAVDLARVSLGQADKLRASIIERAGELNVPVRQDKILVERAGPNTMHVSMSWSEEVNILGVYQKTLDFSIDITE